MRSLGRTPTDKELNDILHQIDTDNNGTIEFDEFVDLMGRNPLSPKLADGAPWGEDSELYYAFSVFDKDSSGKISVDELEQVMKNLGEFLRLKFECITWTRGVLDAYMPGGTQARN